MKLGCVDIITEVSILTSHISIPREGHLDALFHVFGYLQKKHNFRLIFDPTYPDIDMSDFIQTDWKHFYGEVEEPKPPDAPEPRGKEVDMRLYVDSDHAGDKKHSRSRTGFFVFLNSSLIGWLSKKQSTIETSVFGAELFTMKVGIEYIRGLQYKLSMVGVPITGPAFVYGDNMSMIHITQCPESTFEMKSTRSHFSLVYLRVFAGRHGSQPWPNLT